ncbi:MAG: tyrosine-type recombinase/integrase [Kofleriaceae bacterium]|nr:tyrosine-type recombinase/integrase [Candidatus Methylomirabilis lanthanidiphila]
MAPSPPPAATSSNVRHSLATYLLEDGYDIWRVLELLGHRDVSATMIYTHPLNRSDRRGQRPVDRLGSGLGGSLRRVG